MTPGISFVTTCKNRLAHVRETLPRLVAEMPDEIIFVDYGCPQGSGRWVQEHYPSVKVLFVTDDPGFHAARARNLGAAAARYEWLCLIDADIRVAPGFVTWLREHVNPHLHFRCAPVDGVRDLETWGTVLCTRAAFEQIGGYDEVFDGWAGEDTDLYERLRFAGVAEDAYPARFVDPIRHDHALRTVYHRVKDRDIQLFLVHAYIWIKLGLMKASGLGQLPLEQRRALKAHIEQRTGAWLAGDMAEPPRFEFRVDAPPQHLAGSFHLRARHTITFDVQNLSAAPDAAPQG